MDDFEQRLRRELERHAPQRLTIEGARAAAVLIPIVAGAPPSLIFTVRTETLPSHKGQISFPGGSIDPDDPSAEFAALRETQEEIGLDPGSVKILGELDSFPTFVSGYVVTPFVGWLEQQPELDPNPAEVAALLQVPIYDLNEDVRAEPGFSHGQRTYPTEAWIWKGHVIWGVTARVIRSFLSVLSDAGLAERPGGRANWPMPGAAEGMRASG